MLILRGSPALSNFRLRKLLEDLNAAGVPAAGVSAEFVHVVEAIAALRGTTQEAIAEAATGNFTRLFNP